MHVTDLVRWLPLTICLALISTASAASRDVGPGMPLVIPISDVIGGTDVKNNAKNNPGGGYFSVYDAIKEFQYPATHGNQLGNTAMVNDHTYWDSSPGGLDHTHAPQPDPGGGNALWWPIPGEWAAYQFTVTTPGTYTVLTRFSASWGPGQSAQISLTIDGVSSGPVPLVPDDAKLWSDTKYQVGGWWGHTMVSGTSPVGWTLGAGTHVLKVQIEKFPEKPMDHGNIWIHYFKVLTAANAAKPPVVVLKPAAPRKAATKLAAPTKPPPEPEAPVVAALPPAAAGGWTPPAREQAVSTMKALIIAGVEKSPQEVPLSLFGKPQQVVVSAASERGLTVKMAGTSAGLELPWDRLALSDLAVLGRACISGNAERALTVGESCIAFDLKPLADEVLHLAARLDPKLNAAVAQRLAFIAVR